MTKLLLGHDCEVFVKKGGKNISVHDILPGTKADPFKVSKGAIQVDGTAAEMNIIPAGNMSDWITNIDTVLGILQEMLGKDATICVDPVANYGFDYLASLPESATELGCNPDFNAYTEAVNAKPDAAIPFRSAGGHIHFGFLPDLDGEPENILYQKYVSEFVRELDFYLTLPSLFLDTHPDSAKRRQLYGKPGCFRPKVYGFEFRSLSNFWLGSSKLKEWAWSASTKGWERIEAGERLFNKYPGIEGICTSANLKEAEKIINKEGIYIV